MPPKRRRGPRSGGGGQGQNQQGQGAQPQQGSEQGGQQNGTPVEIKLPDSVTQTPPCRHNEWMCSDRRRHFVTLRCLACEVKWKTCLKEFSKCPDFHAEGRFCPRGENCEHPHVYARSRICEAPSRKAKAAAEAQAAAQSGPPRVQTMPVMETPQPLSHERQYQTFPGPFKKSMLSDANPSHPVSEGLRKTESPPGLFIPSPAEPSITEASRIKSMPVMHKDPVQLSGDVRSATLPVSGWDILKGEQAKSDGESSEASPTRQTQPHLASSLFAANRIGTQPLSGDDPLPLGEFDPHAQTMPTFQTPMSGLSEDALAQSQSHLPKNDSTTSSLNRCGTAPGQELRSVLTGETNVAGALLTDRACTMPGWHPNTTADEEEEEEDEKKGMAARKNTTGTGISNELRRKLAEDGDCILNNVQLEQSIG